jgi:hypothetical protein
MKIIFLLIVAVSYIFCYEIKQKQCDTECISSHKSLDVCYNGECLICDSNTLNCNLNSHDGCEISNTDTKHCGHCNNNCQEYTSKTGNCIAENNAIWCEDCPELHANCDLDPTNGCESSILHDNDNCGECGIKCQNGQTCQTGVCLCPHNGASCNDVCTFLYADPLNCGTCGNVCENSLICIDNQCGCPPGLNLCEDSCVDFSVSNDNHCGFCGNACDADKKCIDFSCQ